MAEQKADRQREILVGDLSASVFLNVTAELSRKLKVAAALEGRPYSEILRPVIMDEIERIFEKHGMKIEW